MNRWDMVIGKPAPPPFADSEFEKDGRRVGEVEIPRDLLDIISKKSMTIKTSKGNKRAFIHTDYGNYATEDIWGLK